MKVSLDWLRRYVPIQIEGTALAELLTAKALSVDTVEQVGNDWVLDVEVTSNRTDCLGHMGVARQIASIIRAKFTEPEIQLLEDGTAVDQRSSVQVIDTRLCPLYSARVISDVKVGPSPAWMVSLLEAIGLRSINNVVDITNFVLMESGQPLHAFDHGKLGEGRIVVRRAEKGEKIASIDGHEHVLKESMLVIADAKAPVAVAGVMGGLATEVSEQTSTILLESAWFDPVSVRSTARGLGLFSDSSYRFERGIDPHGVDWASRRASALICELCGGKVAPGQISVGRTPPASRTIAFRPDRAAALLGYSLDKDDAVTLFKRMDFELQEDNDRLLVTVPSRRRDLQREVDLIEEVAQLNGYEHLVGSPRMPVEILAPSHREQLLSEIRSQLTGSGFFETINFSFLDRKLAEVFGQNVSQASQVRDDTRKHNNLLRHNIIPSLAMAMHANESTGQRGGWFFEIATVFGACNGSTLPVQKLQLGMIAARSEYRQILGVVESIVAAVSDPSSLRVTAQPCVGFDPKQTAQLYLGEAVLGSVGRLSDEAIAAADLREAAVGAFLDLETLLAGRPTSVPFKPIPRFPAIVRDFSAVTDSSLTWKQIEQAIAALNIKDMSKLSFVGTYHGKQVAAGKKSVTFSVEFRSPQTTLTHEQADEYAAKIVDALAGLGAGLRT